MTRALSQMMYLQWKAARWLLLPFVLLCFGLPQLAVRLSSQTAVLDDATISGSWLIYALQSWMPLFPLLAAVSGFAAALSVWHWDHKVHHIYALSLPMTRARYATLKLGAGAASLLAPVAALLAGAIVATVALDMPAGLRGYPFSFTMHFLLAALLAYALGFAMAAGTIRTTIIIFVTIIVFVVFGTIVTGYINAETALDLATPMEILTELFVHWAGPFRVFGSEWTLIDV
jgi:hypothetical protein